MSLNIRKHFIMTIVAAPRAGKTHLIEYLLYDLCVVRKLFTGIIIFTGSPHYYYGKLPEMYINETYSNDKM